MRLKPEKQVETQVLLWCRRHQVQAYVIEASTFSKASYGATRRRVMKERHAPDGFSDLCGVCSNGRAFFVELKAPGRLSTIKRDQYLFLRKNIESNAFACCVDSIDLLEKHWRQFHSIQDAKQRQAYLLGVLPGRKKYEPDFQKSVTKIK